VKVPALMNPVNPRMPWAVNVPTSVPSAATCAAKLPTMAPFLEAGVHPGDEPEPRLV